MLRQVLNVLALVVVLVVNTLANALPLNGVTTGQVSDQFRVYFVPAGYVFSIWGLIYVGLIAYVIYRVLPSNRSNPRLLRIDAPFILSCAANAVWIFLWHYGLFALTLVAMFTLLGSLIVIYLRLGIGRERVTAAEHWLAHVPFSVYLGWITVATVANVTSVLYWAGWNGGGLAPQAWAVVMLVVGALITVAMIVRHADLAYTLVITWAYIGVAVKQSATPEVAYTAIVLGVVVLALAIAAAIRRLRETRARPA